LFTFSGVGADAMASVNTPLLGNEKQKDENCEHYKYTAVCIKIVISFVTSDTLIGL